MKLCTFVPAPGGSPRLGALTSGGDVADLAALHRERSGNESPHLRDALAFLDGGGPAREDAERALESARHAPAPGSVFPAAQVTLMAPVPRPRTIRDCMAFPEHVQRSTRRMVGRVFPPAAWLDAGFHRLTGISLVGGPSRAWKEHPRYYKSNVHSVVGTGAEVRWPSYSEQLDYELEFGVFIGRAGADISVARAREHVAGYCIFNDFSARDVQLGELRAFLGPAKSKDFDTGNAMGPWLVTPDEVPDPYALTMVARVNGEEWSRGTSAGMHHRFEDIIAWASRDETLQPGEFIGSGTVGGGCGLELDRWLKPGDEVELEVTGLGVLRNRVVRPPRPSAS